MNKKQIMGFAFPRFKVSYIMDELQMKFGF